MKRFWIRRGLRFLAFALLFVGLAGLAVMTLWNALLPALVGVPAITFGQAVGLLVLSRILFGGSRGYGFGRGGWGRGYERGQANPAVRRHGRANPRRANPRWAEWKQKMAERWQQMTPEEREQLKQRWNRCGGQGRWASQPDQPAQDQPTTTAI